MNHLEEKLEEIYEEVFHAAVLRLHDEDAAYDITQNVMELVLARAGQLRSIASFKQWALKITRNETNLYFRSLKRYNERFVSIGDEQLESMESQAAVQESLEADFLQKLITEEDKRIVMKALRQLDEKYRQVIHLHIFAEYNFIEISEALRINVNTVRSRYIRGIKKLKEIFERLEKGGRDG